MSVIIVAALVGTFVPIILDKNGEETYRSVGYADEGEKLSKILYEKY